MTPAPRMRDRGARFERNALPYMGLLYPRAADDPQPRRRRGPGAGDLRQGLLRVLAVHPGTSLRAWLHRILANTLINTVRKRGLAPPGRSAEAEALDKMADSESYPLPRSRDHAAPSAP